MTVIPSIIREPRKFAALCTLLMLVISVGCQEQQSTQIHPVDGIDGAAEAIQPDGDTFRYEEVQFLDVVNDSPGKIVVVDFWATWCGPCRMMSPELETLATKRDDIIVLKVDVTKEQALAAHFEISSIPDVRFFRDGKGIGRSVGFRTADQLLAALPD